MDSARDIVSREVIDAEQLWLIDLVDKERYVCPGCNVQIWPASYLRGVNKKRPYFTLGKSGQHVVPCNVDGSEKLILTAKTKGINRPQGFPLPFPNKLILTDSRPVQVNSDPLSIENIGFAPCSRDHERSRDLLHHGHTVKTLRPICRAFMNYPYDRASLPLHVPNCRGSNFSSIFRRLGKLVRFQDQTHLYYAALQWPAPIQTTAHIEWLLDAGDWNTARNRRGTSYRVRVHWSQWSSVQRDTLKHEVDFALQEAKAKGGQVKAWMFFVGTQNIDDYTLLELDRYQLICCLEGPKSLEPLRDSTF
jgi:hypothetical protein